MSRRSERSQPLTTTPEIHAELKKIANKKGMNVAALIRFETLNLIHATSVDAPVTPSPPKEDLTHLLKEQPPTAIVYSVPFKGVKICAAKNSDSGWKGIIFHPEEMNHLASWTDSDLVIPLWARVPLTTKALLFIASRIDDEGMTYFTVPNTSIKIATRWNGREFEGGQIIEGTIRQDWEKAGWFSFMLRGQFSYKANVRKHLNMLCRAISVKDGGLQATVPLH